ncbi:PBP1A family penicillin-binding protein [soil metagenome]
MNSQNAFDRAGAPARPRTRGARALRGIFFATVGLVVLVLALSAWVWFAPCALGGCAPVDQLAEYQAEGSELLDVEGNSFGTLATVNRRLIAVDSLPPHVTGAFVAVEDRRFYQHGGMDIRRVAGALLSNVRAGGVSEGGSTISMQLARNLFPDWLPYQDRSMRRKVMEARVARQIERNFSKDKILELYLNHIYLGEGAYGIEAASRTYFGKPAAELTHAEAALLGGLPKAPSQINPVANPERARERRDLVLREMMQAGVLTADEGAAALAEPISLTRGLASDDDLEGSYFIERVRREMEEVVGSRFYTAGLKIHTTLDRTAQMAAEEELARQLTGIESGRFGTYRHATYSASDEVSASSGETPYLQGVVIIMESSTGEVRALVGGRDFKHSRFDRATLAMRQPGSAFKPFVYLAALQRYGSPVHIVEDSPLRLTISGSQVWEPRNYGGTYDGPMTMRDALARSKNTATVRLSQEVGMRSAIDLASRLGISSDMPDVPSTALGSAAVRPIELVSAYAAFSNGGHKVEPRFIQRVEDRHGRTLWEAPRQRSQTIDPAAAFVLTSMLRDVVDRGTGTAVRAAGFRGPAAGKTGTTNGNTDVWFVGYTPDLVGGVWIGMDKPANIVNGASGGTLAAPIWGRVMNRIYQNRTMPSAWAPPPGVSSAEVERETGVVTDGSCPARGATYTEYFVRSAPPQQSCRPTASYAGVYGDTLRGDEEWDDLSVIDGSRDTTAGIEWPELEELRRRARAGVGSDQEQQRGGSTPPPTGSAGDTLRGAPPVIGRPATPTPPRPAQPRAEPEERPARPDTTPLLGRPVQRDTSVASGASDAEGSGS